MVYRYLLFHKPYNVLCQFTDDSPPAQPRQLLKDFISVPDVYPVGRLDQDSEGLMLLTNHGALQHRLSDPKFGHSRTYWAQVETIPDAEALACLCRGVKIQDYVSRPAIATLMPTEPELPPRNPPIRYRQSIPTAWLEITLTEGRNRQVRRMTAAVGCPTLRLVRAKMGDLSLSGLAPGEWRDVTSEEREYLLSQMRR